MQLISGQPKVQNPNEPFLGKPTASLLHLYGYLRSWPLFELRCIRSMSKRPSTPDVKLTALTALRRPHTVFGGPIALCNLEPQTRIQAAASGPCIDHRGRLQNVAGAPPQSKSSAERPSPCWTADITLGLDTHRETKPSPHNLSKGKSNDAP